MVSQIKCHGDLAYLPTVRRWVERYICQFLLYSESKIKVEYKYRPLYLLAYGNSIHSQILMQLQTFLKNLCVAFCIQHSETLRHLPPAVNQKKKIDQNLILMHFFKYEIPTHNVSLNTYF